jgi:hypothetical protein
LTPKDDNWWKQPPTRFDKFATLLFLGLMAFMAWAVLATCVDAANGVPRFKFYWAGPAVISFLIFVLLVMRPKNRKDDFLVKFLAGGKRYIPYWIFALLFSVFITPQLFFFYFHSQGYTRCDDHALQRENDKVGKPTMFRYWVLDASECLPYESRNRWIGKVFSKD